MPRICRGATPPFIRWPLTGYVDAVATVRQWLPSEIRRERIGDLSGLLWPLTEKKG